MRETRLKGRHSHAVLHDTHTVGVEAFAQSTGSSVDGDDRVRVNLLGVGIDAVDLPRAVQRTLTALKTGRRGYICVTGVHGVMEAQRDPAFARILNGSLLTTPDGMPTVWFGRLRGHRIARVYGPEFMYAVCSAGVAHGLRHFLLGGRPGIAEHLRSALLARIPGLQISGTFTPPFRELTPVEETRLIESCSAAPPDIIWVGLGTPKQERFMAAHVERLPCRVMVGVGAAFDFHAGAIAQAPRWMQRSGLEWVFRLMMEPRRLWRRYLINNPLFLVHLADQLIRPARYPAPWSGNG